MCRNTGTFGFGATLIITSITFRAMPLVLAKITLFKLCGHSLKISQISLWTGKRE